MANSYGYGDENRDEDKGMEACCLYFFLTLFGIVTLSVLFVTERLRRKPRS
mgnify:CR=1 FL=1